MAWGRRDYFTRQAQLTYQSVTLRPCPRRASYRLQREVTERHSESFANVMQRGFSTLRFHITRNHEDAEDALQDSFLSAFLHLDTFDGRSSFSTWLTRIAINAALMKIRKNRVSREIPMHEPAGTRDALRQFEPIDEHLDPEEDYAQQEHQTVLVGAVSSLRPALRNVIQIREFQEASIKETAQRLGLSVAAAKGRLFHARAALRKALRPISMGRARTRRAA